MNINELIVSGVVFNEREHTYTTPDGVRLHGVTSIISTVLFPDKYSGIPEDVLRRAAERGTRIHNLCQETDLFEELVREDNPVEVLQYMAMKDAFNINMIANEYLVTDGEYVATMIDCIDTLGNLYDIKTTRKLDTDSLSWQLSFCAYMFELQNPHLKAGRLYGIWLRAEHTEAQLVEVERKSNEEILATIEAHKSGIALPVANAYTESDELVRVRDIESEIIGFKKAIDELEERKKSYLEGIKADMQARGIKKVETPKMLVTLIEDSVSQTLDSKRLQIEHPELCAQYLKETKRKGYVKITLRV